MLEVDLTLPQSLLTCRVDGAMAEASCNEQAQNSASGSGGGEHPGTCRVFLEQ